MRRKNIISKKSDKKLPRKTFNIRNIEVIKQYGEEPDWSNITIESENYNSMITNAFNWANAAFEYDQLKQMFISANNQSDLVKKVLPLPDYHFYSVGIYSWLKLNNAPFTEQMEIFYQDRIKKLIDKSDQLVKEKNKEKEEKEDFSLSTDVKKKLDYQKIYPKIEIYCNNNLVDDEKIFNLLISEKPHDYSLELLKKHFEQSVSETKEYIKFITKFPKELKKQKALLSQYEKTLLQIINYISSKTLKKQSERKPRKQKQKKSKPLSKIVEKMKYRKIDSDLNINSINPETIVNSKCLFVFNTKLRKFGLYYAKENETLSVKGTSIINYDETKSLQKTLRKPKEQLQEIVQTTQKRAEKVFSEIKAIASGLSGRINEDIILLKVIK